MATQEDFIDGVPATELVTLLSVPPEQFVSARSARVKELRSDGRRDEAAALAKVRKPLRLVWTIGEVARRDPGLARAAVAAAEDAGESMGGHGDVREVFARLREVVGRMSAAGRTIDATVDRAGLELALRQVLSDPAARRAWAAGRLLKLPEVEAATADELAPRRARRAAERAEAHTRPTETEIVAPKETEAERRARERARSRVLEAEATATAARTAHDAATTSWRDLEQRLTALEAEVASAQRVVDETANALEQAEHRLATAQAAVDDVDGA